MRFLIGCSPANRVDAPASLALTHVTLIDGRDGRPLSDATIIIRGGRIVAVGTSSQLPVPPGARVLELRNHFVTPGFIDTHYHVTTGAMRYRRTPPDGALDSTYDRALAERLLRVALSRGTTTIRDPGASPLAAAVALRDDVAGGRVLGPRVFTAGPILSSPRLTENEIRSAILAQAAAGVDYIKLYAGISPSQLHIAIDEAHKHGLKVIGHLQRTSWSEASREGIDFLTHAGNWHDTYVPESRRADYAALGGGMRARIAWLEWLQVDGPAVDSMVRALTRHGVSVDPTLIAYHTKFWWRDSIYQKTRTAPSSRRSSPTGECSGMHTADWTPAEFDRVQAAWPKQLALVRRLHRGGVLLTVGSDVASPWVIPGVSFHQELAPLETAGLSREELLRMATANGAQALGIAGETGTLEPGKRADLVVLGARSTGGHRELEAYSLRDARWDTVPAGCPAEADAPREG